MTALALLLDLREPTLAAAVDDLVAYLGRAGVAVTPGRSLPDLAVRRPDAVLVLSDRGLDAGGAETATALLDAGVPLLLAGPTLAAWGGVEAITDAAGLIPGRPTPRHEIRVRPGPDAGELTDRMDGDLVVEDRWLLLDKVADDVEVLLTATMGLAAHPVATLRRTAGTIGVLTVGSEPSTLRQPAYQRLVHRWVRVALGKRDGAPVRAGLLGYGAIGDEHLAGIAGVDGLELAAVCDTNAARRAAAREVVPSAASYDRPEALVDAADVDLVVVSTPPNSHADWALRLLDAGKSVVVEKPLSITVAEADEMIALAAERGLGMAVYQNRRWDADYLALKAAIRSGAIGEVFHYESFVGGYGHPCNYWHSDEVVSGGAIYDWGSHYLDWVLDLLPQPIAHVTAATHKRVWHDVTNADHSRVTLRFDDGVEAEFVHSDLAAARRPKWYVLGTAGALVGDWAGPGEFAAGLRLFGADGSVAEVPVPPAPSYPFHRELADQLLSGVPMSITPAGSRRVVSVMEAATRSAREGGRPVVPAP